MEYKEERSTQINKYKIIIIDIQSDTYKIYVYFINFKLFIREKKYDM